MITLPNRFTVRLLFYFVFTLIGVPAMAQPDLYNGLVACYSFSGNALDGTANHYDGAVHGPTLVADRFGNPASAYEFSGLQSIQIPPGGFLNPTYTYSAWVNPDIIPSVGEVGNIVSIGDVGSNYHQVINLSNLYAEAQVSGWGVGGFNVGGGVSAAQGGYLPLPHQWYNITGSRSADSMKLYINGRLLRTGTTSGLLPDYGNGTNAEIGTRSNGQQYFQGVIDDVVIYNRALSNEEVMKLYTDGVPCGPVPPFTVANANACGPHSLKLTAAPGNDFLWYDGPTGGNLLFTGNPFLTPILSTTTDYYVIRNVPGNPNPRQKVTVIINPLPQVVCNFPTEFDLGVTETFSADASNGTAPYKYYWTMTGTGIDSTSGNPLKYSYQNAGNYNPAVRIKDARGCQAQCSALILVDVPLMVNEVSSCGPNSFVLTANQGTDLLWYDAPTGGNLIFQGNPFKTPLLNVTTVYYVARNHPEPNARLKVTAAIYPIPTATCLFPSEFNFGATKTFSVSIADGTYPYFFYWTMAGNELDSTTVDSLQYRYKKPGKYEPAVLIRDIHGCEASCDASVLVNFDPFVPNILTINADTVNNKLTLFSKHNGIYSPYKEAQPFLMVVTNRWGKEVFRTRDVGQGWNGENAQEGIYFYVINAWYLYYRGWVDIRH